MKVFKYTIYGLFLVSMMISCKPDSKNKNTSAEEKTAASSSTSDYMNHEKKILSYLTTEDIPEDFPTYIEGETPKQYRRRAMLWAKEHLELIKPEYKDRVKNFH